MNEKYTLSEVTTNTAQVFKNQETEETLTSQELLLEIANSLETLKKQLIG